MARTSAAGPFTEKPFFRYDLETTAREEGGNRYVDISDPETGTSFRLYEVEYAVACGMDGQRDLSALVSWAKQELDLETSAAELRSIVSKLGELRYLGSLGGAIEVEVPSDDVELGTPGKSPIAKQVAAPPLADNIALGMPGRGIASGPKLSSAVLDMDLGDAGGTSDMESDQVTELGKPSKLLENFNQGIAEARAAEEKVAAEAKAAGEAKAAEELAAAKAKAAAEAKAAAKELAAAEAKAAEELAEAEAKVAEELAAAEAKVAEELAAAKAKAAPPVPTPPPSVPGKAREATADISAAIATDAEEAAADTAVSLPEKEKKDKPKVTAPAARPQVAPDSSSNRMLFGLLIVVAIAAAAYYYFVDQKSQTSETSSPKPVDVATVTKPPVAPEAVLKVFEAPATEALAVQAGVVTWVTVAGTEVAEGADLVKLGGTERLDRELQKDQTALAQYQAKLETLKVNGPAHRLALAEGNLERKKADIEAIKVKLAAFVVTAPNAGVVDPLVEEGARILAEQVVAKVAGLGRTSATFTLPAGTTVSVGDELDVVARDDAELRATCKVEKVANQTVTVDCPPDKGFAPDSAVELQLTK